MKQIFVIAALILFAVPAHAEENSAVFFSVDMFRSAPIVDQLAYVRGMHDMLVFMSDVTEAPGFESLVTCTKPMTLNQLHAVFEKRVKDMPENWHTRAPGEYFVAIANLCTDEAPK